MPEGYHRHIISMILAGEIADRDALQRAKVRLCGEHGLKAVPPNSEILAHARDEERETVLPLLMRKPMRTISGVAVVAVMTEPHPCPHGRCSFCPGGMETGSPQSYTGKEPAARRAIRHEYDPYSQVRDRIDQLEAIGHRSDKIDLIIMGGTITSLSWDYQENFVRRCLDAMNGRPASSLEEAQLWNGTAEHRCIGLTLETRPDSLGPEELERTLRLGATRVEIGVQILDDEILQAVNRGHGTLEVAEATRRAKEAGLKVCYHLMPGLPGSSPERDLESLRRALDDSAFRPDMLKIYSTLVMPGTPLHESWLKGDYVPYDTETGIALLAEMKALVPNWLRIQRVQRDIPVPEIAAGIRRSNIRELVREKLISEGRPCRCIRCREVGHRGQWPDGLESLEERSIVYDASGGREHFLTLEHSDSLVGYARLRLNEDGGARLRELKVFGRMTPLGESGDGWQHRGFGGELLRRAEEVARDEGADSLLITSGVGARNYYRRHGYELDRPYMRKAL